MDRTFPCYEDVIGAWVKGGSDMNMNDVKG
jgi:hypothetical protein